ncbi:hypothetical protein [Roseomonas haemaphysalidis]|uniref:Uncharacterized protein n=1 Tax=Roseomonas haemaphysalidis TaxID=2768162 RepID=A0ABS3KW09_9PROT|nr:hypothetical protein [Roseomonas haemaphysalidis]MBO1081661.1 hypothetical protein [Roseomonas haemaphysalidis]
MIGFRDAAQIVESCSAEAEPDVATALSLLAMGLRWRSGFPDGNEHPADMTAGYGFMFPALRPTLLDLADRMRAFPD